MAEFETLDSNVHDFGAAGFVAFETRQVKEGVKEPSSFLVIARGFYLKDGSARRRNFVTLPDRPDVLRWLAAACLAKLAAMQPGDADIQAARRALVEAEESAAQPAPDPCPIHVAGLAHDGMCAERLAAAKLAAAKPKA